MHEKEAEMKDRIPQYFFVLLIAAFVCMIGIYGAKSSDIDIKAVREASAELNSSEKAYISRHDSISIYVDEDLRHLMGDGERGFLQDYMNDILEPAGMKAELTFSPKEADCRLAVITETLRAKGDEIEYTSPVFQMEGALFIRDGADTSGGLTGVAVKERSDAIPDKLTYDGRNIDFVYAEDAETAVSKARSGGLDFILGDRSSLLPALDGAGDYLPLEEDIYNLNVCIVTEKGNSAVHNILNKYIHAADRHKLTYEEGQKWLDGSGPLYMKERYEDLYMLILIIFTAIMIVFFIYYNANKNLYRELDDRMEKLAESKQELKTTFNGVSYLLAELDLEGSILDINRALYDVVQSESFNRKIWDVLPLDSENSHALQQMTEETASGRKAAKTELTVKRSIMEIDLFPIENAKGSVDKLLFMARDITSEIMAERQLLQDNKMIAVGQLAAGVAHEIRNPLGIIRNYCYVLKNMEDEGVRKKAIERIENAVDKSGAIINNLLNFSRISVTRGEMIDVEEHIRSLTSLNANLFRKKNINLELICPERVETFISTESLDMILINLISNAADAMNDDGNLTIKVVKYNDNFEIEVRDTGTGIEEDILQDIFNPFFTTKGSNKGNGLGLYIVYNETNKLNGKISVQSKVGEGSVFRLTIPLRDDESREEANDQGKSEDPGGR